MRYPAPCPLALRRNAILAGRASIREERHPVIQPIVTDEEKLTMKAEKATPEDAGVIQDLLDTFTEHSDECVCMAANMIGVNKRIIVIADALEGTKVMVNPMIVDKKQAYFAQEGCLSRPDSPDRGAKRFKRIRVNYLDADFEEHTDNFQGFGAQIIQHAVDHCNGVHI